jgi:hypothetical protein
LAFTFRTGRCCVAAETEIVPQKISVDTVKVRQDIMSSS